MLKYASACSNCLQIAKRSGRSPSCDSFVSNVFKEKRYVTTNKISSKSGSARGDHVISVHTY